MFSDFFAIAYYLRGKKFDIVPYAAASFRYMNAFIFFRAITDSYCQLSFSLPHLEVGGFVRSVMNVSTFINAELDYNFNSRVLKTEVKTPSQVKEILTLRKKAYHFLKADRVGKKSETHATNKRNNGGISWGDWVASLFRSHRRNQDSETDQDSETGTYGQGYNDDQDSQTGTEGHRYTYGKDTETGTDGHGDDYNKDTFGGYRWSRRGDEYENKGRKDASYWSEHGHAGHRFRRSLDDKTTEKKHISVVEAHSYTKVSTRAATPGLSPHERKALHKDQSTTTSTYSTVSSSFSKSTATSTSTATVSTSQETRGQATNPTSSTSTDSTTGSQTDSIHPQTSSSTSYSIKPASSVHHDTEEPHGTHTKRYPGWYPSRPTRMIKVPIEIDQLGKIEVLGMDRRPDIYAKWVLKVQQKYVSVRGGRVSLSSTPTILNVIFHGKNRRIVSFKAPDNSFITVSPDSPCLITSRRERNPNSMFVITMVGHNITTIRSIASLRPSKIPQSWGIARGAELEELEEVQRIFQKELVELDSEESILEQRVGNFLHFRKRSPNKIPRGGGSLGVCNSASPQFHKQKLVISAIRKGPE